MKMPFLVLRLSKVERPKHFRVGIIKYLLDTDDEYGIAG
jgi:hypothetical protein